MKRNKKTVLKYDEKIKNNLTSLGIDFFDFYKDSFQTSKYYMLKELKSNMVKWELFYADGILHFSYGLIDSLQCEKYYNQKTYLIYKDKVDWDFIKNKAEESIKIDNQLVDFLEIN